MWLFGSVVQISLLYTYLAIAVNIWGIFLLYTGVYGKVINIQNQKKTFPS